MTVRGFRRFAEPSKVRLDGRLIAFVGPNEAGKSTLLGTGGRPLLDRSNLRVLAAVHDALVVALDARSR